MPTPILATKLFIPLPRPKIVCRPRLIERMNEGRHCKLTLISAPAGFGKTTLVSEWVASCDRPVAWVSLDEGDNVPKSFLAYLVAALQTIAANIGAEALRMLQSPQPPPIESILIVLVNEIASILDNFVFVLDDYHVIDSGPVDEALSFLVEHAPLQMHLVIATREDPHLSLSRLRARGQLTELRAADLRFSLAEAADFLNRVMGLNLSAEDIAALETRTEGWIVGLQLAALSMQGHQDTASFIKSFTGSHYFVLDYLLEEVLHQQSESVQAFLLRTSILNRLCGPLCDTVLCTTTGSGQETLEYLERANLFIIPLDNERRWYRYHHLFGDLLRQRLGQRLSPAEIAEYHLRASQWYEKSGDESEAFHHAFAAGDYGRAAGLAESAWRGMDDLFQTAAWLGWVKKLPEEVICLRPVLNAQIGLAYMDAGKPEASETRLRDAERCLKDSPDEMVVVDQAQLKLLPAIIAIARAYNAQVQGNLSDTIKYAELALQHIPEDDLFRRAQATITLEITHWTSGDLESARSALGNWMNSVQKVGNYAFMVASAFVMADILIEQGHLREAEKTYQQALQIAAEQGKEVQQITAHHHLGLALIYHELGEDEAAAPHLQTAAELGKHTTLVDWAYRWCLAQARFKEARGEWDAALELIDQAGQVYVKNPIPVLRPIEALKARVYLKQGRLDRARAWALERGLSVDGEASYLSEYEYVTLARVRLAEGSFTGVNRLLERLLALAEAQKRGGSTLEILLVQALAHRAQGSQPQALETLGRALALAEPEGYLRIFVDEGEPLRLLILEGQLGVGKQPHNPVPDYVKKILAAFPQAVETTSQFKVGSRKGEIIEPLSEREIEILRLVAQGLSNAQISQRLYLALSTVKGHNLRIFAKLEVQNRTEAVARARALGLL